MRFVIEHHDVEWVGEPCGERLDLRAARHPRAEQLLVVGEIERDLMPARRQAVRELEHAAYSAVSPQVRFDDAEAQTGHGGEA